MKAIAQYMPLVLFLTLYKVVLTFENVDKILKNYELYIPVHSCGAGKLLFGNVSTWQSSITQNWNSTTPDKLGIVPL